MCLTTFSKPRLKEAKQDIGCFKVLRKVGDKYFSPYMETEVFLGKVNLAIGATDIKTKYHTAYHKEYSLSNGLIHCFQHKQEAIDECCSLNARDGGPNRINRYVVVSANIIKGSKYITGYYNGLSIAGKKVKYIKEVYDELKEQSVSSFTSETPSYNDTSSFTI